ncbi:MAG: histone deacetylase [Leptospiraceae bacterium]|nr:histone deacetylase [Leptospiraceae bacterium]
MKRTGIVYSEKFLEHDTGFTHPENKNRLSSIISLLQSKSYYQEIHKFTPKEATKEDIISIHEEGYYDSLKDIEGKSGYLDGDTPYSPGSLEAAKLAAGSGIVLADKILSNEIDNGMVLVRPPGHHAESGHAMGFCIFNNIAITAKYLQKKGKKKVLILDWDVHHGNGTQNSFYEDDSVLFISLHQFPFYPGSGSEREDGSGAGKGYTLNLPMARGMGDSDYIKGFEDKIIPKIDKFSPDFVLISAGFDAHKNDPLAQMELSTSAYEKFSILLKKAALDHCEGKIISFLEGGYDLSALSESVEAHLSVLL